MTVTLEDIQSLVAHHLGRDRVAPDDRLFEELGATSLDAVNILAAVEDRYGVWIEDAELPDLQTVADLFDCVRGRVGPR